MQLKPRHKVLIEEMRKRIADRESFGISLVDDYITLRWGEPMKEVTMQINSVDFGNPSCFLCEEEIIGTPYKTEMSYKLCSGRITSFEVNTEVSMCYDCYCPK